MKEVLRLFRMCFPVRTGLLVSDILLSLYTDPSPLPGTRGSIVLLVSESVCFIQRMPRGQAVPFPDPARRGVHLELWGACMCLFLVCERVNDTQQIQSDSLRHNRDRYLGNLEHRVICFPRAQIISQSWRNPSLCRRTVKGLKQFCPRSRD